MEFEIISKQDHIPDALISKILAQIPKGINIYLSLNRYGEGDWLHEAL